MAKYIDAEKLKDIFESKGDMATGTPKQVFYNAAKIVDTLPAADVMEVKHGHNASHMHPVDEFACSVCGFTCTDYTETKYNEDGDYTYHCECEFNYCPNCGAKMEQILRIVGDEVKDVTSPELIKRYKHYFSNDYIDDDTEE